MAQNKGNCVFSHVMQQVLLTPIEGVELRCEFFLSCTRNNSGVQRCTNYMSKYDTDILH